MVFTSIFKSNSPLSKKAAKAMAAIGLMMTLGMAAAPAHASWQESWQQWNDWLVVLDEFFEALGGAAGTLAYDDF